MIKINRKKVLFLTDSLNVGGAEKQLLLLSQSLPYSWRPTIISFCDGPLFQKAQEAGIHTILVKRKKRFDALSPTLAIGKLIEAIRPDIIHSWGWMSTIVSSVLRRKMNIPLVSGVVRLGGVPVKNYYRIKFASRLGDITIGNSQAGLNAWKVPARRGRVVHNGFDWTRIPNSIETQKKESDSFKVTMIANMAPRKDWEGFIRVAELSHSIHSTRNIVFCGYGTGPLRDNLLLRSKEIRSTGTLVLPGKTDKPIEVCLQSDLGVLLSTYGEGISNTIMEYMACELPVICSNSGGNPELLDNKVTGFLVEPNNPPEQILEKIIWAQEHPLESKQMGAAGKQKLQSDFSVEKLVRTTTEVYNELL